MAACIKTKGLSTHRLKDNLEEARFAELWAEWNRYGRTTLSYLLDPSHGGGGRPVEPTDREGEVAATVVQWLGSPVGQSFLEEAGYMRVTKPR